MSDTLVEPLKICIDCKYIGTNRSGTVETYKCFAPQNKVGTDLVTGADKLRHAACYDARSDATVIQPSCGTLGIWYEPKPRPVVTIPQVKNSILGDFLDTFVTRDSEEVAATASAARDKLAALLKARGK